MRSTNAIPIIIVIFSLLILGFSGVNLGSAQPGAPPVAHAVVVPASKPVAPARPDIRANGNTTNFTLPCWSVNLTICVGFNATTINGSDVVPQAPYLNASYPNYPGVGNDLLFDVYSTYNLQKNWGGSNSTQELSGPLAYLYLNVTDVEWNGIPWFCSCDDSIWHANANVNWAPNAFLYVNQTVTNFITNPQGAPGKLMAHFRYTLTISGMGTSANNQPAPNFPAGSYVQWSVSSTKASGSNNTGYTNSTQKNFGGPFTYYVGGAWFWAGSSCFPREPCYPNAPTANSINCPLLGQNPSAAAFRCNIQTTMNPPGGGPSVNTPVVVSLQTNATAQNYTKALMSGASIALTAYYPNGTFWRTWSAGFKPYQHWPTFSANVSIPAAFFQNAGSSVDFNITAWDGYDDALVSQNFSEVTNTSGIFPPGTTFVQNINLTTDPGYIGNETPDGLDNGTYPGLPIGTVLNVSIASRNSSVPLEMAWLVAHINFSSSGYQQTVVMSMDRIVSAYWYLNLKALPMGSNVSFYVKVWDANQTTLSSHWYHFYVPTIVNPTANEGFFYVEVYDNRSDAWVTGANVSIIGEDGAVTIKTQTFAGMAYPNVTGKQFTPTFLPANATYAITVHWAGFSAAGTLNGTHGIRVQIFLTHQMTTDKVLAAGANWIVKEVKDVILFSLNVPAPPPTFSHSVTPGYMYLLSGLGLLAASAMVWPVYTMWRGIRRKAEEEEKRITL